MTKNMTGISVASTELQDTDFMQEVSSQTSRVPPERQDQAHTLWFLCAFTEQLHGALSVGTGIGPTAKAPGCFRIGP